MGLETPDSGDGPHGRVIDARRLLAPAGVAAVRNEYVGMALRRLDAAGNWREARRRLHELHRIVHEQVAIIPLWQTVNYLAHFVLTHGLVDALTAASGHVLHVSSSATIFQHLEALATKGWLRRRAGRWVVPPEVRRDLGIPIVGQVAAGAPITAIEHIDGQLDAEFLGLTAGRFSVRVTGDLAPYIPAADIVLTGHAVPSGGQPDEPTSPIPGGAVPGGPDR